MKKLIVLNFVGLLAVVVLAGFLVRVATNAQHETERLRGFARVEVEAAEIRTQMIAMSDSMRGYLLNTHDRTEADKKQVADDALSAAVKRLLENATDPAFVELAGKIGELDETQLDRIEDQVLEIAATDAAAATKKYFGDYVPVRAQQMKMVDELGRRASEGYELEQNRAKAEMAGTVSWVLFGGGAAILLMIGACTWAAITAAGVTHRLRLESAALAESAGNALDAAREVARAAQSLSQGATEQAASLEETSASMEEMASMTRQNAEHSANAAMLMTEVDESVQQSNKALTDMVTSMQSITDSGHQVAKIIKTIDEIAFQTNILALNAAVEAARAGEAGMGFAVVADEVRNLAQRSAQAARDTADLIDDSIKRTTAGGHNVEQVAQSIARITDSVAQVKSLIEAVSSASRQQAQGIDQVSQAIAQIEKVTQGTAATAEQSAAASEELQAQANGTFESVCSLEELVGRRETPRWSGSATAKDTPKPTAKVLRMSVERPAGRVPSNEEQLPLADTGTFGRF